MPTVSLSCPSRRVSRLPPALFSGLLAVASAVALAACATPPPASDQAALADYRETNDPLEPTNRVFYRINNAIDTVLLRPAAQAYRAVVPQPVRNGIHNFLANIGTPVLLSNDILQAKPRRAGDTLMRFVINTTAGVGGVFDVASDLGYKSHDTGFGTTLAVWGVSEGPFLYLPVLGPSNPRDAVGFGTDIAIDPFTWVGQGTTVTVLNWTRFGVGAIDQRERLLDAIDSIKKTALDPYATFRSLYRQHRASEIAATIADDRHTIPVWFPAQAGPAPATKPAAVVLPLPGLSVPGR
jgi:phospholipid-binding lipoprotein MlaA